MYTDVDSKYGGSRPRSLKVMALMASLSMAMVGLVGLGLAAPASADTAPACPADTIDTTWELVGNVCVGTTTETAPSEAAEIYSCPEGYEAGPDFPAADSCLKYETITVSEDRPIDTYTCPGMKKVYAEAGSTLPAEPEDFVVPESGCYEQVGADKEWEKTGTQPRPVYGDCAEGWTAVRDQCERSEQVVESTEDPEMTTGYTCPEGFSSADDPITEQTLCTRVTITEQTATCPVAGDVLTNLGDEEAANWQCVTPATPAAPVSSGGSAVFTASATASGSQDICLVDGVTTVAISYDETGTGSGPTTGDAEYLANVATVAAVNAAITAQTPEGATLGACGAPITEVPVVVNPVAPATVPAAEPEAVAVPAAATVPTAVAAGGGSQAPAVPTWALALAIAGVLGAAAAGSRLVTTKK